MNLDNLRYWDVESLESVQNPKKPLLEDFYLNEYRVEKIEEEKKKIIDKKTKIVERIPIIIYVSLIVVGFYYIWDDLIVSFDINSVILLGGILFATFFPIVVVSLIVGGLIEKPVQKYYDSKLNKIKGLDRLEIYNKATKKYEDELRKYQEAQLKLKEYKRVKREREKRLEEIKQAKYWKELDGHSFEKEVAVVLQKLGYDVNLTSGSGDWGVDLFLNKGEIVVQCKATKSPVSPAVVRDLFGTMNHFGAKKGIIISLGGFTSGSYEFKKGKSIEFWGMKKLLELANQVSL